MNSLLLLPFICHAMTTVALDCKEGGPVERKFEKIADYLSDLNSFKPSDKSYKGNHISFSTNTISVLKKKQFLRGTAEYLMKIDLKGKSIQAVDDGAFESLSCLQDLELSNNSIGVLNPDTFLGLGNLEVLNISNNIIAYLPDYSFEHLQSIKDLDISHNKLKSIAPMALTKISSLEKLDLSYNRLKSALSYFDNLENLHELLMSHNNFRLISFNIFINNSRLERIDLSNNGIIWADVVISSHKLDSVKFVNLSHNLMEHLQVENLKHRFPNKDFTIDINNNDFSCEELKTYLQEFEQEGMSYSPGRSLDGILNHKGIACDHNSGSEEEHNENYKEWKKNMEKLKFKNQQQKAVYAMDYLLKEMGKEANGHYKKENQNKVLSDFLNVVQGPGAGANVENVTDLAPTLDVELNTETTVKAVTEQEKKPVTLTPPPTQQIEKQPVVPSPPPTSKEETSSTTVVVSVESTTSQVTSPPISSTTAKPEVTSSKIKKSSDNFEVVIIAFSSISAIAICCLLIGCHKEYFRNLTRRVFGQIAPGVETNNTTNNTNDDMIPLQEPAVEE